MSVQASSWVIKYSVHKGSALLLMLMIANHAHSDGTNAFPSISTLAGECRMSERQIKRLIAELELSGELIVEHSKGRKPSNYSINMDGAAATRVVRTIIANSDNLSPLDNKGAEDLNSDKSGKNDDSNSDILSPLTVTNPTLNSDKSGTPTVTNPARYKDNDLNHQGKEEDPAKDPLIAETEKILRFELDIFTQERILDTVPAKFAEQWLTLVKNRLVGNVGAADNYLKSRIGYWLTDFSKELWRYEKDLANSPPQEPAAADEDIDFSGCLLCDERGMRRVKVDGVEGMVKCKHEGMRSAA